MTSIHDILYVVADNPCPVREFAVFASRRREHAAGHPWRRTQHVGIHPAGKTRVNRRILRFASALS
jgi:hypothetical protein